MVEDTINDIRRLRNMRRVLTWFPYQKKVLEQCIEEITKNVNELLTAKKR